MTVSETNATAGQTVYVGSLNTGLSVGADITVAHIVGKDDDNVGLSVRSRWRWW